MRQLEQGSPPSLSRLARLPLQSHRAHPTDLLCLLSHLPPFPTERCRGSIHHRHTPWLQSQRMRELPTQQRTTAFHSPTPLPPHLPPHPSLGSSSRRKERQRMHGRAIVRRRRRDRETRRWPSSSVPLYPLHLLLLLPRRRSRGRGRDRRWQPRHCLGLPLLLRRARPQSQLTRPALKNILRSPQPFLRPLSTLAPHPLFFLDFTPAPPRLLPLASVPRKCKAGKVKRATNRPSGRRRELAALEMRLTPSSAADSTGYRLEPPVCRICTACRSTRGMRVWCRAMRMW